MAADAREPTDDTPWATEIGESQVDADICRVRVTAFHDNACQPSWQLELRPREGLWRIRSMIDVPPAHP